MDHETVRRSRSVVPDIDEVRAPHGRRFWVTYEMLPRDRRGGVKPTFSITGVAKIFFARSGDWVRYLGGREDKPLTLDGQELVPERTKSGNRVYNLADVERMAHALVQHGRIDATQFINTIQMVRWMACQYRIIPANDMIVEIQEPMAGQVALWEEETEDE